MLIQRKMSTTITTIIDDNNLNNLTTVEQHQNYQQFTDSLSTNNAGGNTGYNHENDFIGNYSLNDEMTNEWISEKVVYFLSFYYIPTLVLTGTIGNILSVLVFFKTKLRKLSSSHYLAALGFSDTCFLLIVLINWLNVAGVTLSNQRFFCQTFIYMSGVCSFLSVWFVVAFTVERFIAVLYPLKRQTMCTVRRAKIVLCGLTIIGAMESSPLLLFSSVIYSDRMNATVCDLKTEYKNHMKIFNYVDTVLVFVVPFTAIVILNSFTGFTVWKVAGVRRTMTAHRRAPGTIHEKRRQQANMLNEPKCTHPYGNHSIRQSCPTTGRQRVANSSQMKVTKMLLIVSSVFVCLNLPSYVMRVRAFLEKEGGSRTTIVIQYFCHFFFLTNFGINFVLYCVSGQNFRKAIVSMFRKASSEQRQECVTQHTVSECIRTNSTNASRRRITKNGGTSWNTTAKTVTISSDDSHGGATDVQELCIMSSTKRG